MKLNGNRVLINLVWARNFSISELGRASMGIRGNPVRLLQQQLPQQFFIDSVAIIANLLRWTLPFTTKIFRHSPTCAAYQLLALAWVDNTVSVGYEPHE